ncbi:MAG TPA: tRNA lysidine(34) synthetase TilS [Burkholderiales bacterium]|nr:tRNA lysidine(34) synthetase TilS [Burkholderiales bacterium]
MSAEMLRAVQEALGACTVPGRRIAVGLSGGMDSVVLLDLLQRLRETSGLSLSAVHVNHQISPRAGQWEEFCGALCARLGIALAVRRVQVPQGGAGLEAEARRLRYAAYAATDADFVALAHHLDDQAETILLQLMRGAGPRGLAAMPLLRAQPGAPAILRPLLECRRSRLAEYARARGLEWVQDDSNGDPRHDRNFLRNEVLPALEARFPAYRETMARAARNLADQASLAEELARLDAGPGGLDAVAVERLRELPHARALNLLRALFAMRGLRMPPRARLQEALRQCREARGDAQIDVTFEGASLRCYRGSVQLVQPEGELPPAWSSAWDGCGELVLPQGCGVLRARAVTGTGIARRHFDAGRATVCGRSGGERMQAGHDRPRRTLKNLLREHAVAPWQRRSMPLVLVGGELAWAPGIGVAVPFRASGSEPGVAPEWEPG